MTLDAKRISRPAEHAVSNVHKWVLRGRHRHVRAARLPGDAVFARRDLLMVGDFVATLRPLYPQALDRLIFQASVQFHHRREPVE